ncbi:MAG: nucleoside-triphosphatase [Candidatus Ozemobacteraceae bacterium]
MVRIAPENLPPPKDRDPRAWPLLTLLIGPVDSGKTTFLRRWYETWKWGDGFLSVKRFAGSRLIGYDLERLSSGESCPWARVVGEEPSGWQPWIEVGPFRMFREGLSFAAGIVDSVMDAQCGPMILDEAGPLELNGSGFAPLLEELLSENHPTLVSVRDFCLSGFLSRFPTADPRIVQVAKTSQ